MFGSCILFSLVELRDGHAGVKELFIMRHGETEWNVAGRMQGRLDSALTEQGRNQADLNGGLVKALGGVDVLLVSPSGRTRETAYIVNSHTQVRMEFFEELMERDCGLWSGMAVTDVEARFPQAWAERELDAFNFRPPEGENLSDMLHRARGFLEELYVSKHESVGLVTHGVMSKVILNFFLSLSEAETVKVRHPNELVYRLTFNTNHVETHYFLEGGEANTGLLMHRQDPVQHPSSR